MSDPAGLAIKKVTQLIEPVLEEMGFELVDVEYRSERGRWILRIYADSEGGITVDDCARLSRQVGNLIDVKEVIAHEYVLEVSSPGLNRPLKKERDFLQSIDKKIKVRTISPVDGRSRFTGYLRKIHEDTLHIEVDGNLVALPLRSIDKANIVYSFDS
jgi:ribosome maturation factor RimP